MNNQHLDYKSDNPNYQTMENELYLKDYIIIIRIHLKKIIMIFLIALGLGEFILHTVKPKFRAKCHYYGDAKTWITITPKFW